MQRMGSPTGPMASHASLLAAMEGGWMVRGCQAYQEELKACRSVRGRFHQYYVSGETADCSQWRDNLADCRLWEEKAEPEAAARIMEREGARIADRLRPHFENTVWEKRTAPPEDWSRELPAYMTARQEESFLTKYTRAKEKAEAANSSELMMMEVQAKAASTMCSIM